MRVGIETGIGPLSENFSRRDLLWGRPFLKGLCPFFYGILNLCIPHEIKGFALKKSQSNLNLRRIHDKMMFNPGHSVKCKSRIEVRELHQMAHLQQRSPKRSNEE
ncbi:hypothetical protein JOD24_000140 [Kroppenstedtia sanguinis]|uniref:hypothetical protein n=1 Tax=Kroppenstedtia sanguinis TaxID=1380684 RepID=UPI0036D2D884